MLFLHSVWVSLKISTAKVRLKSELCKKTAKKINGYHRRAIRLCVLPFISPYYIFNFGSS